jgi:hypothetical protein
MPGALGRADFLGYMLDALYRRDGRTTVFLNQQ